MAELVTVARSEIDYQAGRKATPSEFNRVRAMIVETGDVWSAANGDTFATHLVIPAGSRLMGAVRLSNAAGATSSTLALGIRDAKTKVAIDATAIMPATSIASAQSLSVSGGTKTTNGQYYLMPSDVEVYGTFGGADPQANQRLYAILEFISP